MNQTTTITMPSINNSSTVTGAYMECARCGMKINGGTYVSGVLVCGWCIPNHFSPIIPCSCGSEIEQLKEEILKLKKIIKDDGT